MLKGGDLKKCMFCSLCIITDDLYNHPCSPKQCLSHVALQLNDKRRNPPIIPKNGGSPLREYKYIDIRHHLKDRKKDKTSNNTPK